jgi:hypothetical protein
VSEVVVLTFSNDVFEERRWMDVSSEVVGAVWSDLFPSLVFVFRQLNECRLVGRC